MLQVGGSGTTGNIPSAALDPLRGPVRGEWQMCIA